MKQREVLTGRRRLAGIRSLRVAMAAIVGFVLLGTAPGARADCGLTGGAKAGSIRMPMIVGAGNGPEEDRERHGSIVGLWHTIYTSGGSTFSESFKMWHSDGTEFENVDHNPAIGSVREGVWKQVNARELRPHDGRPEARSGRQAHCRDHPVRAEGRLGRPVFRAARE